MLEMVTFNHIKHKHMGSNTSPLMLKVGGVPTCTIDEDYIEEVVDCIPSGMLSPWLPFFLASEKLVEVPPPDDSLPFRQLSVLVSEQGFFAMEPCLDYDTECFCSLNCKPALVLVLPPLKAVKD